MKIRLLAHNIRSLHNVGAFFRTADAFGVEKLYLTGYTGHPPRDEITKVALGAEEWLLWEGGSDPKPFLEECRKDGFRIVALEQTPNALDIHDYMPPDKLCLIVGHEVDGVPPELLEESDEAIQIPMMRKKESLNVSVAVGVALFALRRD